MNRITIIAVIMGSVLASGCQYIPTYSGEQEEPVYKYNPIERQYELTHTDSRLRYNVMEREWVYVK